MLPRPIILTLLLLSVSACQLGEVVEVDGATSAVVYGNDDRKDLYQVTDPILRDITTRAIMAPVPLEQLDMSNPEDVRFVGVPTLREGFNQCPDEPFGDQPTAAFCSTTLISDDLIISVGHCFDASNCGSVAFVFGYYYEAEGRMPTIRADDVYRCGRVVTSVDRVTDAAFHDYAIIELDRPVTADRRPVNLRQEPLAEGEPVSIIGFGMGIPAKIDSGGRVIDPNLPRRDTFLATLDAFGGNSGSGVFDGSGRLVGMLSSGNEDYTTRGGCDAINRLPDPPADGNAEIVSYAANAMDDLCAMGAGRALCTSPGSCGDGACAAGEPTTCPDDCTGPMTPIGWMCPAESFWGGDGCDCGCGAVDPDCMDVTAPVNGCAPGAACDRSGQCAPGDTRPPPEADPPASRDCPADLNTWECPAPGTRSGPSSHGLVSACAVAWSSAARAPVVPSSIMLLLVAWRRLNVRKGR